MIMQTSTDDFGDGLLRKLLLVDDEVDGAEFAAALLRLHGLPVRVVHSASEALQALRCDDEIDAVLTDFMMPGMNGLQLAQTVRSNYPSIKIIMMSGYEPPASLDDGGHSCLFVSKPYRIDTILGLLRG